MKQLGINILYFTVCDDCSPPWINSKTKNLMAKKILLRSAISKITAMFNYFEDFRTFRIS